MRQGSNRGPEEKSYYDIDDKYNRNRDRFSGPLTDFDEKSNSSESEHDSNDEEDSSDEDLELLREYEKLKKEREQEKIE